MKTALCIATLLSTAAAQEKAINVNFNACSGAGGGGASAAMPAMPNKEQVGTCNVKKLVRYVETDFPPFDDLDPATQEHAGLSTDLWNEMCENAPSLANVQCHSVRDSWSEIWTPEGFPGRSLKTGVYDFATAFVNKLRENSFAYSHHIFERVGNHFVSLSSYGTTKFPDQGAGVKIGLICSWGDTPLVREQYKLAEFVCADDSDGQFALLDDGEVDVIWVGETEWDNIDAHRNADVDTYKIVGQRQVLDLGPHHENAVAFMFAKENVCARELVNVALEEVMTSSFWGELCAKYPVACKDAPQ